MISPPAPSDPCAARAGDDVRRKRGLGIVSSSLVALTLACAPHDALVGAQDPDEAGGKVGADTSGTGGASRASSTGKAGGPIGAAAVGGSEVGGGAAIGGSQDTGVIGGAAPVGGTALGGGTYIGGSGGTSGSANIGGNQSWPAAEAEPGGVAWEPWPEVEEAPANTCRVSVVSSGDSAEAGVFRTETWLFDAATRVLTRHSDGDGTPSFRYVRFDPQGKRELQYSSSSPTECEEWFRDQLGNTETYMLTTPLEGAFDPTTTYPDARQKNVFQATRYWHKYDQGGWLESTEIYYPGRGGGQTFFRDRAQARCEQVLSEIAPDEIANQESVDELERWTYQGGRVATRVTTAAADSTDVRRVVRFAYDAKGVLASTVVDGYAAIPQPYEVVKPHFDGSADYVVRTVEQADGSRWLEVLDFTLPNAKSKIMRDGVSTPVMHLRWHFSAGCRLLDLPERTSRDCEFDRPLYTMPIGWDDPYVTPIRPQAMVGAD